MTTLKFFIIIMFLAFFAKINGQISLEECRKLGRANHPYAKDKQRIATGTQLKEKNASSLWYPQLNANAQATYQSDALEIEMMKPDFSTPVPTFTPVSMKSSQDQYKLTLDVNQMIYDGGSVKAQRKIYTSVAKADELQNEASLQRIDEQINNLYFSILITNDRIRLFENVRNTYLQRQKSVEAGLRNGVLQQSDLDNITIELLKNQQQIDEFILNKKYLMANLSTLCGKSFSENEEFTLPEVGYSDTINWQRPELQAMEIQQESLNYNAELVKSTRKPKLYAFAQGGYGKPGLNMVKDEFDSFYIVGISLKWNIWDWDKSKRDRQLISLQSEMLQSGKEALQINLNLQLNNSKSQIEQLEKALVTDRQIVDLRKEVSRRSASKLDNGVITSSEYILDQNAEIQSLIQLQTHEKQLLKEKLNYQMIMGN